MTLNVGILNPDIISRGIRESKIDLATPVNIYTSLRENQRAQSLADLTLDEAEKKELRTKKIQAVMKGSLKENGQVDGLKAMEGLNLIGEFDAAHSIEDRMFKKQESLLKQQEEQRKAEDEVSTALGKTAKAVIGSKNPVGAFMLFKEEGIKKGYPLSRGLLDYIPTQEEEFDGRLDPKVAMEMDYLSKKYIPTNKNLSFEEKLALQESKYDEMIAANKEIAQTKSDIKVEQPLTKAEISRENIAKSKLGFDKEDLVLKKNKNEREEKEAVRDEAKFAQEKLENARKNKAFTQKNKSELKSVQNFLDRAVSVSKSKDFDKVSGLGRFSWEGSEIPLKESKGKDLQADIDYLVDLGVIETMTKLKAESPNGSTGFGALSEKEMGVLKSAFSVLGNPNISANKKKVEVDRVIKILDQRAREQRILDNSNDELLGPEKTAEDELNDAIDNF